MRTWRVSVLTQLGRLASSLTARSDLWQLEEHGSPGGRDTGLLELVATRCDPSSLRSAGLRVRLRGWVR